MQWGRNRLFVWSSARAYPTFSWFNLNNAKYKDLVSGYSFYMGSHGVANKLLIYNSIT